MPNATGAQTKILGLTETDFNTVPAVPDAEVLYVRTFELADNTGREQDPTLAGGFRGQLRGSDGRADAGGNSLVSIAPESIGFWLKHLIGVPTTVGASAPYTHTFQVGTGANALPPGIMFQEDYGPRIDIPGRLVWWNGVRISSGQFSFSTSTPQQQATFTMIAASRPVLAAATIDETPNDPGHSAWSVQNISLELDDGATEVCIETLNVNWDNDLETDAYCLNNGGERHGLVEGQAIITGDATAQFDTNALMVKAFADEDLKVVLSLTRGTGDGTAGNEQLVLTIPLASTNRSVPPINGPRGLRQNFTFVAHRVGGAEVGVTAVLKNARATI